MHRLDKTKFIASKIEVHKGIKDAWRERPLLERLSAAWILSCRVYDLDPSLNHRIDRTKFRVRHRDG